MARVRWEPVGELTTLQNEMNRLFSTFFDPADSGGTNGASVRRWVPPMDLVEAADHFVLRADLPGLGPDDVNLEVEDNVLTLSGERKAEHESKGEGYYRLERASGHFRRSLTLPESVNLEHIAASFDKGVLEIRIPKPEQRKPRKVAINVGGAQPAAIEGEESAS
jgi:HSP20 family protein